MMELNKVYYGNCLELLKQLDDEAIQCVVTSPPYYGLRSYETEDVVFDGLKDCPHTWEEKITSRNNASGGKSNKLFLKRKGKENFQEYVDYHDRTTKSDICLNCGAWKGSLGLEPEPEMYINHLLQIFKERTHHGRREFVDRQAINRFLSRFAHERQQEDQRIPITGLSIAGEITVRDEMLQKETANPRADQGIVTHGAPPIERSVRSADWLPAAVLGSC